MKNGLKILIAFSILLFGGILFLFRGIEDRVKASVLKENYVWNKDFREQELPYPLFEQLKSREAKESFGELLAATMLSQDFHPKELCREYASFEKYKPDLWKEIVDAYCAVWADGKVFPVPSFEASFENGWYDLRQFGGERFHEGTDVFGSHKEAGYDPVLSITDGTVEKIGWLPLGGYRIGIRAPHGGYFYYAHFYSYAKDFEEGDEVRAGDLLGFMGDSGYGEEGTTGKFPVHLHVGIYIPLQSGEEVSVNPYYVLQNLQKSIRTYTYE